MSMRTQDIGGNVAGPRDGSGSAPGDTGITRLLADVASGDDGAWDEVYRLLYGDIHRIACSLVRQHARHGHSPTSLISETWLRLAQSRASVTSREHLVSLIARAMRFVLVDQARKVLAARRGNGVVPETISEEVEQVASMDLDLEQLLMIDDAFESLARISPRLARVVELRYFGGMEEAEIAALLDVNVRTVRRDWRKARAYLQTHLDPVSGQ